MALVTGRAQFLGQLAMKNWLTTNSKVLASTKIQVATLKATYGGKFDYPKPWPYKTKKLNPLSEMFDIESKSRLVENSKIICVEGNLGVGKKEFAQRLAKEFDLIYVPPVHDDHIFNYIFGYDERMIDELVSEEARCYDLKCFFSDPHPEKGSVGRLQHPYFYSKYLAYAEGLSHLLNTGQGMVVVRSPFGDDVFVEAFRKLGWITKNYYKFYHKLNSNMICDLLKPHITLFLDAPVDTCMERVLAKKDPREVGGEEKIRQLLPAMEAAYKNIWMKKQRVHHEVLEIDWTEIGDNIDMDVIAEELEGLELENHNLEDPKFREWSFVDEDEMARLRFCYRDDTEARKLYGALYHAFEAPEAKLTRDCYEERLSIYNQHAAFKFTKGSARELGNNETWKLF